MDTYIRYADRYLFISSGLLSRYPMDTIDRKIKYGKFIHLEYGTARREGCIDSVFDMLTNHKKYGYSQCLVIDDEIVGIFLEPDEVLSILMNEEYTKEYTKEYDYEA